MKRLAQVAGIGLLALAAIAAGTDAYLHSGMFRAQVERYVQTQIEQSLGARVEIGGFGLQLWPARLDFRNLVVHGREGAGQPALAAIPELRVGVRLRALLHGEIQLGQVEVEGPQFHIYPLADGNLNLPEPLAPWLRRERETTTLFAFAAEAVTVEHGGLDIEQRHVPLDLHVSDAALRLGLTGGGAGGTTAYEGELRFRQAAASYGKWGPAPITVDAAFRLQTGGIDLGPATLTLPGATLRAQGTLRDFLHPTLALQWQAQGELRRWDMRLAAGVAQAQGQFDWRPQGWSARGAVRAQGVRLAEAPAGVWQAAGNFEAQPAGLALTGWKLEGLGGTWRAEAHEPEWKNLEATGTLAGVRMAEAAPLLRYTGLDRKLAGRLEAGLAGLRSLAAGSWTWRKGRAEAVLELSAEAGGGERGLAGRIQATWLADRQELELQSAQLSIGAGPRMTAGGSELSAQGSLGPAGADLKLAATTADWGELERLAASFGLGGAPPVAGRGRFTGELQGGLAAPVVTGELDAQEVRAGTAPRLWTADSLSLAGRLAADGAHLDHATLQRGGERFSASGDIGLRGYRIVAASALHLRVQGEHLRLATLQQLAGLNYPVQGEFSVTAALGGRWEAPTGEASLELRNARWRTQTIPRVAGTFTLQQFRLRSTNLEVDLPHTQVRGSLELGLRDHSYRVQVASAAVELADLGLVQSPRLALRGVLRFQLNGSGSWERPTATMVLTTSGLRGGGESLGDLGARIELLPGGAAGGAVARFQAADILANGSFNLDGTVGLGAPYPVQAALHLRTYDLDAWLRRFTTLQLTGHSHVSGQATLQGPLEHPDELTATVTLDPIELAVAGLEVHNQGAVRLEAAGRELRLAPARMVANATAGASAGGTDFTLQAQARLGPTLGSPAPLSGSVNGQVDLALIEALHPASHVAGTVAVNARLGGTLGDPRLAGEATIRGGSFAEGDLPIGFDQIQGELRLTDNRLQIVQLTAHTGSGSLALSGYAARSAGGYSFDVNLSGQNLRLRYEGISTSGDLQLRLSGQSSGALLTGTAQLNRVALGPNFDLAVFLATLQSNPTPPNPDSLLNRIRMDIHLVTGPQVEVATSLAHLSLQADLRLRGTLGQPSVLGHAGASEGRLLFAGNQFQVTKAQVQFDNPYRLDPILDIGLSTTVQQYDVSLNLSGPADKLAITYRSDPPLASADVVALLATGQPTQATAALAPTNASFAGTSEQILGQALDNLVAERLHRLFGITQVQVNPDTGPMGPTGSGGTVTIEQQVARNLKLTYTQNLASSAQDIVQVEWTVNRKVGITLSRDQFGLYGLKFTFRQRAR